MDFNSRKYSMGDRSTGYKSPFGILDGGYFDYQNQVSVFCLFTIDFVLINNNRLQNTNQMLF